MTDALYNIVYMTLYIFNGPIILGPSIGVIGEEGHCQIIGSPLPIAQRTVALGCGLQGKSGIPPDSTAMGKMAADLENSDLLLLGRE